MLLHDKPFMPPGLGRARRATAVTTAITSADHGLVLDCTAGTYDVTATAAATLGSGFSFGLYNSGSGTVTFNPASSETIRTPAGTATTLALSQGQGLFLVSDGANWSVVCAIGLAAAPSTTLTVTDAAFTITGSSDATKTLKFEVDTSGAGFLTTIDVGVQTGSRTLSIPVLAGADTLMTLATAQSLTGLKTFPDNAIKIVGSSDSTKSLLFELDNQTASVGITLNTGAQTGSWQISLPVVGANDTLMGLGTAQTVTGLKSFQDSALLIVGSSDASKTLKFEVDAQSANADLTIDSGAQTVDRTLSVPVLGQNSTLAVIDQAQTFTGTQTFGAIAATTIANSGIHTNSNATDATSISDGSSTHAGGVSVTKALWVGGLADIAGAATVHGLTIVDTGTGALPSAVAANTLRIAAADATPPRIEVFGFATTAMNIRARIAGTSRAGISAATNGQAFFSFNMNGYDGIAWYDGGGWNAKADALWSATNHGTYHEFSGIQTGTTSSGIWATFRDGAIISPIARAKGVTITATAAGTTVLAYFSATEVQTFTGSTTQTITFPAANARGAGIGICYTINNQSSGTVTPTRAGSDTFQGGGTTDPVLAGASQNYISDGVSLWMKV